MKPFVWTAQRKVFSMALPITHRMHLLSVKCAHNRWLARANFSLQRRLVQLLLLFLLCYVRWVIHGHELLHP